MGTDRMVRRLRGLAVLRVVNVAVLQVAVVVGVLSVARDPGAGSPCAPLDLGLMRGC